MMQEDSAIVHISMLKSGTHLVRNVISQLTGMNFREPEIIPGHNNYEDQKKFFSHLTAIFLGTCSPTRARRNF